jgi:hypothetical protein
MSGDHVEIVRPIVCAHLRSSAQASRSRRSMSGARQADHLDVCAWREAQFLARRVGWLREIVDSKVVQKRSKHSSSKDSAGDA